MFRGDSSYSDTAFAAKPIATKGQGGQYTNDIGATMGARMPQPAETEGGLSPAPNMTFKQPESRGNFDKAKTSSPLSEANVGRATSDLKARTNLTGKDVERLLEGSMMIRDADMSVAVKSAREAKDQLRTTIESWKGDGAKILTTNLNATETETKLVAEIRVPESRFEETLDVLAKMGTVLTEHSSSEDVTNQVVDTTVRARSWATQLEALKKQLANSSDKAERAQLKAQIHQAQLELDSWNTQKEILDKQTLFSRIHVTFVESKDGTLVSDSWSQGSLSSASSGLKSIGRFVGSLLIYVLVYIPVWLPLALFGLWYKKRNA
jgi:hypothetical protein